MFFGIFGISGTFVVISCDVTLKQIKMRNRQVISYSTFISDSFTKDRNGVDWYFYQDGVGKNYLINRDRLNGVGTLYAVRLP